MIVFFRKQQRYGFASHCYRLFVMASFVEYFVAILFLLFVAPVLWKKFKRRKRLQNTMDSVLVFSRYPQSGRTKTRLIPDLGAEGAAYCQLLMTEHVLQRLEKISEEMDRNLEVELLCAGGTAKQIDYWLDKFGKKTLIEWSDQVKGDLGHKMRSAVFTKFSQGRERVIIIGSDIPGISKNEILEAFRMLQSGSDMVLGKASDGGYYLVGFNRRALRFLDDVFVGIDWGTDVVFQQQMTKAKELNAYVGVLSSILSDVDTAEDLKIFERNIGLRTEDLVKWKWSVIIPTLNEAGNIRQTLDSVIQNMSDKHILVDVVISDGGSQDATTDIIKQYRETSPVPIHIVNSCPGRGFQLRAGAERATGDYFLFVHADTTVPPHFDDLASKCLRVPGNVAGAFCFGFDIFDSDRAGGDEGLWIRFILRQVQFYVGFRCWKFELPYGDQGLFVSRKTYQEVGGFSQVYLMEDVIMVEKLKKKGHVAIADKPPIYTSSRRWKKNGAIRTTAFNNFIFSCYKLGMHPNTLAKWYYGKKFAALLKNNKKEQ